jgi:hypothetical protein
MAPTRSRRRPALPDHPRLLIEGPPLWRRPGELQVGLGSHRLVLSGVPGYLPRAIGLLDGWHDRDDVVGAVGSHWADWLLRTLDGHAVLAEGPPARPRRRVGVLGGGALADAVAARLEGLGCPVDHGAPEVVVVAPDTAEPDRVAVAALARDGVPHLVARFGYGRAILGPFVLPGTTSCLTCLDLGRRQNDPAWPLLAFQLAQVTPPDDPLLAGWLLAGVMTQVAAWEAGRLPETCSATQTLDVADAATGWTAWPVHPACGCATP